MSRKGGPDQRRKRLSKVATHSSTSPADSRLGTLHDIVGRDGNVVHCERSAQCIWTRLDNLGLGIRSKVCAHTHPRPEPVSHVIRGMVLHMVLPAQTPSRRHRASRAHNPDTHCVPVLIAGQHGAEINTHCMSPPRRLPPSCLQRQLPRSSKQ